MGVAVSADSTVRLRQPIPVPVHCGGDPDIRGRFGGRSGRGHVESSRSQHVALAGRGRELVVPRRYGRAVIARGPTDVRGDNESSGPRPIFQHRRGHLRVCAFGRLTGRLKVEAEPVMVQHATAPGVPADVDHSAYRARGDRQVDRARTRASATAGQGQGQHGGKGYPGHGPASEAYRPPGLFAPRTSSSVVVQCLSSLGSSHAA